MESQESPSPFSSVFYLLYLVIRLFIFIGEIVKKILFSPYYLARCLFWILKQLGEGMCQIGKIIIGFVIFFKKQAVLFFYRSIQLIQFRKQTLNIWSNKKLKRPKITIPHVSVPKIPSVHIPLSKRIIPKLPSIPFFINIRNITLRIFNARKKQMGSQTETIILPPVPRHIIHHPSFVFRIAHSTGFFILRVFRSLSLFTYRFFRAIIITFFRIIINVLLFPWRLIRGVFTVQIRFFILGFIACSIIILVLQMYQFAKSLPSPRSIGSVNYPVSTLIYDRNGVVLYEIYHDQNRTPIALKDIPPYVYQASIAIEDKDFFNHGGVAFFSGILRAARDMILQKGLQGGSTITQQLVKSALLTPERTIDRKIREIILALWTERLYTKNQILEMYLNQVPYGGSAYGIEEAAKLYFGKSAKDLTIAESALLAGLPQAPSLYSPFSNLEGAITRRNEVLQSMYEQKYITKAQYDEAVLSQVHIVPPEVGIKAPHFVFYVKDQLQARYGMQDVEEGGLRVTSTLDLQIQQVAEQILKEELAKVRDLNITNGAVLVTRPSTGEILAMVGSANYFAQPSGSYNVTIANRQPGSSIKPIMYALALQKGYTAATIIDDSPTAFPISGSETYRPVNYDGKFHGPVPLRIALANSFNIPAVKTLNIIGVHDFTQFATRMGITTWTDTDRYGLSLTLGGAEVRMVDMATAFGVFANQGYRVDLTPFDSIETMRQTTIESLAPTKKKIIDPGISYIISDILSDNFARQWEFGQHSALEIPGYKVSVKTGTTDNKKDNWTIGYTPDYLVAVWVGNNDNAPMNQALASGISGAAPVWNRVMSYLLTNYSTHNTWFQQPEDVISKPCYYGKSEYFIKGTENKVSCASYAVSASPTPVKK